MILVAALDIFSGISARLARSFKSASSQQRTQWVFRVLHFSNLGAVVFKQLNQKKLRPLASCARWLQHCIFGMEYKPSKGTPTRKIIGAQWPPKENYTPMSATVQLFLVVFWNDQLLTKAPRPWGFRDDPKALCTSLSLCARMKSFPQPAKAKCVLYLLHISCNNRPQHSSSLCAKCAKQQLMQGLRSLCGAGRKIFFLRSCCKSANP